MALDLDLLSYYKLDEGSGATAADSQGSFHLADDGLNLTHGVSGILDVARLFNFETAGFSGARLSAVNDTVHDFGDESFSANCWAAPQGNDADFGDSKFVCGKWNAAGNNRQWAIQWNSGTKGWRALISANGSTTVALNANVSSSSDANLQMLTLVYNHLEDWLNFSVDGASPASIAHSGGAFQGNGIFRLAMAGSGAGDDYSDLIVDEVAIWGRAIGGSDVEAVYGGGTPPPFEDYSAPAAAGELEAKVFQYASLNPFDARRFVVKDHLRLHQEGGSPQTYTVIYREVKDA